MPAASTSYPSDLSSDLSEEEWASLAPLLPPATPGGRPRSVDLRQIGAGLLQVLRRGCQWGLLPREYGPWSRISAYWLHILAEVAQGPGWDLDGTWMGPGSRCIRRYASGRDDTSGGSPPPADPSAAIIDSQSVKTTQREHGGSSPLAPRGTTPRTRSAGAHRYRPLYPFSSCCR